MAVDPEGYLRWYCYQGNGEPDVTGSRGWHANSGNRIGRGWNFKDMFVFPAEGHNNVVQLFAVAENGDLHCYGYKGDGQLDPTGGTGWLPNSGNPIGNGWQGLKRLFGGVTDEGGFGHVLMVVNGGNDLLWYKYAGNGESDVSGPAPQSGNRIGANW